MLTPAEVFWGTAFLSILVIRLIADYVKVRLYWDFKQNKITIAQYQTAFKDKGVHVHHFVWGILSAFGSMGAFYWSQDYIGAFLGGLAASLIASEGKELVLQRWGR